MTPAAIEPATFRFVAQQVFITTIKNIRSFKKPD